MIDLKNELEILITKDKSATILNKKIDESYHSVHGALNESNHIFIENGIKQINKTKINVMEIGLGTGLNAALTMDFAKKNKLFVNYFALEPFPPPKTLIEELCNFFEKEIFNEILKINNLSWEKTHLISKYFHLAKWKTKLENFKSDQLFDIIYFDAFSPSKQPELWTAEIFIKLYEMLDISGVLITYSAKGEVRRNLIKAGFKVYSLTGPTGKREITSAIKC